MFYRFRQNNSGGSFDIDPSTGLGVSVYIEADSPDQANTIAEDIGIYFNGCEDGHDCECCGDRWSPAGTYDAVENPEESKWDKSWGDSFIHYSDGRIARLGALEETA